MKTKLTKRSKTDGTLVTVTLNQFEDPSSDTVIFRKTHLIGEEVIAVVDGVPTVFTFARPDKDGHPTAMTTHGLPRSVRLPRVGRPVYAEISEIR